MNSSCRGVWRVWYSRVDSSAVVMGAMPMTTPTMALLTWVRDMASEKK